MRIGLIFLYFILVQIPLEAQTYESKWQIKPAYGANIPLTKFPSKGITDHLIEYQNPSSYAQIIAATWFFKKRWGLSFRHQNLLSKQNSNRGERFETEAEAAFEQEYYVTPSTGARYQSPALFGGLERGLIGLIYRYENDLWFVYPEFSFGVTSFYTDWGNALMKKKNSNDLLRISYSTQKRPNDFVTLALSSSAGYKLSKKFYLNVDVMTSWFRAKVSFEKELIDLNTNFSITEKIDYNKHLFTFSAGAGLIFVMY